jgi:hypothetical protein
MTNAHRSSFIRRCVGAAAAAVALVVVACSEVSAPPASPTRAISSALESARAAKTNLPHSFLVQGLLREKPLDNPVVVTKVIPDGGGSIDVPGTDFQLQVPKGAFDGKQMAITVKALPGYTVAYDFEPHGTVFKVPLKFVQKLGHTNLKGIKPPPGFNTQWSGAYFPKANLVDAVSGIAVVTELLPANLTWTGDQITFPIWHFSGYMVSTGCEDGGSQ